MGLLLTCLSQSLLVIRNPTVDLLVLRVSHHVAQFVAWKPDPYCTATDAILISWTQGHYYEFPPFYLILRVLNKIQQDQVHTITLITPCWQTQLWYPQVLRKLTRRLIQIPSSTTLLLDPKGNPHPLVLNKALMLVAWQASRRDYLSREFLKEQPSCQCTLRNYELA